MDRIPKEWLDFLAASIGFHIRQRVRIGQRGQVDFLALGDEPCAEVDETVV